MQQRDVRLTLLSPAFLGDAFQSGAWRAPPFKALLREWWRIAAAPAHGYRHQQLREAEGRLWGNAWLASGATQSRIRLALASWKSGTFTQWPQNDPGVLHPEVKNKKGEPRHVGSQLYLGYGPLIFDNERRQTALKKNAALQAGETNTVSLAWPGEHDAVLNHTLQLIDWFGTVGGRSRNGWGSLALGLDPLRADHPHLVPILRDFSACLRFDWPHAIGRDQKGPLIWHSLEAFDDWRAAMRFLAQTKIGFRTHLPFQGGQPHREAQNRHLLAYPVTNHAIAAMNHEARLANQLRFRLFRDGDRLRARIYHTPHACPLPMNNLDQRAVWQKIHAWLDDPAHGLVRLGGRP